MLGEQLTPHLAELSTSQARPARPAHPAHSAHSARPPRSTPPTQLKLVTIYINRTTKARADRLDAER